MAVDAVAPCPRRPRHDEEGFTIIEVIASLTILAVAMVAVTTTFYSSLRTSGASSFRSAGAALTTKETEAVHGVAYAAAGFYDGQPGYTSTFEGEPTVTLGTGSPATALLRPLSTVVVGPITYTVRRYVTWADTVDVTGTNLTDAYKKTTVVVTWTDQAGAHTTRQDSIFYPGGQPAYGGATPPPPPPPTPPGLPNPPTGLTPTVPVAPDGYTKVAVAWTAPSTGAAVDHYKVEVATDASFTNVVATALTAGLSNTFSGLASTTIYYFRAFSVSTVSPDESGTSASPSNTGNATTLTPPAASCTVTSMVLSSPSDGGANRKNNGDLNEDITLTLNVTSACGSTVFAARAQFTDGTPNPELASGINPKVFTNSPSATVRTVTWARNSGGWTAGDHKIVLTDGVGTPVTPSTFQLVRVCNNGVSPC